MTKDKERIDRLIRKSETIVRRTLTQIDSLYEDHAVKKAKTILKELTHPLNKQFLLSSRSGKIIQPIKKNTEISKVICSISICATEKT